MTNNGYTIKLAFRHTFNVKLALINRKVIADSKIFKPKNHKL